MQDNSIQTRSPQFVDQAADSASHAIQATRQATDKALDGLDTKVHQMRDRATTGLDAASQRAGELAHQGAQTLRETTHRLRDGAHQLADGTRQYVRDEPVKSVLIAAATGALLMGLASLLARPGR